MKVSVTQDVEIEFELEDRGDSVRILAQTESSSKQCVALIDDRGLHRVAFVAPNIPLPRAPGASSSGRIALAEN